MIGVISGVWGLATIALFITVIRLSYRIEARHLGLPPGTVRWRYAPIPTQLLNINVPRDPQSQADRRQMLLRLGIILAGFALMALVLNLTGGFDTPAPTAGQ